MEYKNVCNNFSVYCRLSNWREEMKEKYKLIENLAVKWDI